MTMTKVLVLYYSAYGHIETMAEAVASFFTSHRSNVFTAAIFQAPIPGGTF